MSRKPATGGPLGATGGAAPRRPNPPPARQSPERSGLPSAVRGAGADMLTSPDAAFGTSGVDCLAHWASSKGDEKASTATTPAALSTTLIPHPPATGNQRIMLDVSEERL